METQEQYMAAIAGLSRLERKVFDCLCCGKDTGMPPKIVSALVEKGLVFPYEAPTKYTPITVTRYDVYPAIHVAWAAQCAKEHK